MEYTVYGMIQGYVYATIEADTIEEAMEIAKKDPELDWKEEWISSPRLIDVTDEKTGAKGYFE